MASITATVITLNDEDVIQDCLASLQWCDEIIVVDSHSDDKTVSIAEEYSDQILQHERTGYVEPIRRFAAENVSGDYILRVDADERVPEELSNKLQNIAGRGVDVVEVPRKNYFFGQWINHAGWWPDYTTIMYRPDSVIHQDEIHNGIQIKSSATIQQLQPVENNAIIHYNYERIEDWISGMNRYSTVHAKQLGFSYKLIFKGFKEFGQRFILQKGYKLGLLGFIMCILRLQYWFLVAWKAAMQDE